MRLPYHELMSTHEGIVVIAHRDEPWRSRVADALIEKGYELKLISDGNEALKVLLGEALSPVQTVLLGSDLEGMGTMDVLYHLKHRMAEAGRTRSNWAVQTILVITDVKDDEPFFKLLADRGVNGFVYRDAEVDTVVAQISGTVYAGRRTAERYSTRMNATLRVHDKPIDGELVDLSINGGLVNVAGELSLALGTELNLTFLHSDMEAAIECQAIVRNVRPQKKLFSHSTAVGLQFLSMAPDSRNRLDELILQLQNRSQQTAVYVNPRFF